jgi:hypothetical protein
MQQIITWLRNKRFRLRQFTAHRPKLFFSLYQLSAHNRKLMVRHNTKITIEGYPRSANTYAVYAFKQVNPMPWNEIGHHLHVQAQIIRSINYNIPVMLLIRHPMEAVRSLVVRHDFIPVDEALSDYCRFYTDLYAYRTGFVVADFDNVIDHYGNIILKLNEKFNSNFSLFPDDDKDVKAAVMNEIDERNRAMDKGKMTHLYRPDKGKETLKNAVDIDENSEAYQAALNVYEKYLEIKLS